MRRRPINWQTGRSRPKRSTHLLTETQVGNAMPFSICLPLKMLAISLRGEEARREKNSGQHDDTGDAAFLAELTS